MIKKIIKLFILSIFSLPMLNNINSFAIPAEIVNLDTIMNKKIQYSEIKDIVPIFKDFYKEVKTKDSLKEKSKQTGIYLNIISSEIFKTPKINYTQTQSIYTNSLAKIIDLNSVNSNLRLVQLSSGGIHGENVSYLKIQFKNNDPTLKLVPEELKEQYDIKGEQNVNICFV